LEQCLDLESDASRSTDACGEPTLHSETAYAVLLGERLNRSLEIVKLCRVLMILKCQPLDRTIDVRPVVI